MDTRGSTHARRARTHRETTTGVGRSVDAMMRRVARACGSSVTVSRAWCAVGVETTSVSAASVACARRPSWCRAVATEPTTTTEPTDPGNVESNDASRRRYSARKIVRGITREALCDVVADVDSYASFVPFCAGARRTPRETWGASRAADAATRGEEYFEADLEIGFKLFSERYTSAVTCARPERVTARSVSSGLFKSMTTTWTFQKLSDAGADLEEEEDDGLGLPMGDGVVVDFEIDFEVNDPVHAAAVSVVFKDVAAAQISAFEKRVRSLALAAMR